MLLLVCPHPQPPTLVQLSSVLVLKCSIKQDICVKVSGKEDVAADPSPKSVGVDDDKQD